MSVKFRKLIGGFEIVLPSGRVLLIDPVVRDQTLTQREEVTGADYIAITHDATIEVRDTGLLVQKYNSKVICSHSLAEPLIKFFNLDFADVIRVTAGNVLVFDDLKVEVKKAEHIGMLQPVRIQYKRETGKEPDHGMTLTELLEAMPSKKPTTPQLEELGKKLKAIGIGHHGEQLNFVFETTDNLRIYMSEAGAYDFMGHELKEGHPHVLIAQLGRGNDPEKLAELAAVSGAQVVIPFAQFARGKEGARLALEAMAKHLAAKSTAHLMDIPSGKWYEIGVKMSAI